MRKLLSLVMALTFISSMTLTGAFAPRLAHAQEVGDTVTVNDVDGNEIGLVTIEEIIDPFEDMEEDPKPGLRFISIELTIENTGDDALDVNPLNIGIVDDAGIIYSDVEITRTDNIESLEGVELDAGDDITGGLEVGLPEESEINHIVWLVGQGQLPSLLNNARPVETGDEVVLNNTDYEEEAVFITEEVVDEFDDLADGVELNDGFKFVGVTVTIENTGEEDFVPEPANIFMATTEGIFWAQDSSLVRSDDSLDDVDDLSDDPIAPGDSVTGFVGFGAPDTSEIAYIFYLPSDSTRFIRIYDADTGGSTGDDDATPDDDQNNGGLGPIGKKTPTPEDNGNTGGDDDDCTGAADWAEFTIESLNDWSALFSDLDPNNLDPVALADNADAIRDIAEAQADSDVPPAAEELNDAIVAAFEDSADALDKIAEGVETNDPALIGKGAEEVSAVGTSFQSGEVAEILADTEEVCPEISDL